MSEKKVLCAAVGCGCERVPGSLFCGPHKRPCGRLGYPPTTDERLDYLINQDDYWMPLGTDDDQ